MENKTFVETINRIDEELNKMNMPERLAALKLLFNEVEIRSISLTDAAEKVVEGYINTMDGD